MKVAMYCRVSTDQQKTDSQEAEIYEYATAHQIVIDSKYIDPKHSATKTQIHQRPDLHRLLRDVQIGEIKMLLVLKRDRLARNLDQYMEIYGIFKKCNLDVRIISENPMGYKTENILNEIVYGYQSQLEGEHIGMRSKAGIDKSLEAGIHGGKPFGYFSKNGQTFREEQKLALVKQIYHEFLYNDFNSLPEFLRYLTKNIIPELKIKIEIEINNYNNIRNMLSHPLYMGLYILNGKEFVEKELAIITAEEWYSAQNKLKKIIKVRDETNKKTIKEMGLLSQIAACSLCGKPLARRYIKTKEGESIFYICPDHYRIKVNAQSFENYVVDELFKRAKILSENKAYFVAAKNLLVNERKLKINAAELSLKKQKKELDRIIDQWVSFDSFEIEQQVHSLGSKYDQLEQEFFDMKRALSTFEEQIEKLKKISQWSNLEYHFIKLPLEKQRELISDIFQSIIVDESNNFKFILTQKILISNLEKVGDL